MLTEIAKNIWHYRAKFVIFGTPLLAATLPIVWPSQETKCACVVIILGIYWMTEVIPMGITGLLPMVLFPMLGVSKATTVAKDYLQDPLFMLIGGLAVALAIEESQLHVRVALNVLLFVGGQTRWILMGIMFTTGFLSMWINNTATTATMIPIVEALLVEIIKCSDVHVHRSERKISKALLEKELGPVEAERVLDSNKLSGGHMAFCKMMLLSICYSANIGGIATITGTGTNIMSFGIIESMYGSNTGVTFASWLAMGFPCAVLNLVIAWAWLLLRFCGWRVLFGMEPNEKGDRKFMLEKALRNRLHVLGKFSWRECATSVLFVLLVALWLFRSPGFMPGWSKLFRKGYVSDSSVVMLIVFLLFIVPAQKPTFSRLTSGRPRSMSNPFKKDTALLDWPTMENKLPWGVLLLTGGSLAMAGAVEESGLSAVIGDYLAKLGHLKPSIVCIIVLTISAFMTEVISNAAAVSLLVPLMALLGERLNVNPLYFILSAVLGISYAFMLPVATAPNALVFGRGLLQVSDMVISGLVMNLFSICVTYFVINTVATAVFGLGEYPAWAPVKHIFDNTTDGRNNSLVEFFNASTASYS